MLNGATYVGTWEEIVRQMKDDAAEWARGSLEQYMAAVAHRGRKEPASPFPPRIRRASFVEARTRGCSGYCIDVGCR